MRSTDLKFETCYSSLPRAGEEICGNILETLEGKTDFSVSFTDGEGDGTRAGIMAAFISKMSMSLLKTGESSLEVVDMVADSFSRTEGGTWHSPSLAVLKISREGDASFAGMNFPAPLVVHRGHVSNIGSLCKTCGSARTASFTVKKGTMIVLFNEGFLRAGTAPGTAWHAEDISEYVRAAYHPDLTAQALSRMLLNAAGSLCRQKPRKDMSVLALRAVYAEN